LFSFSTCRRRASACCLKSSGEITVTVVVTAQDSTSNRPEVVTRIRDNGIGISPDMLSRVFDLFAQADHSLARTQGGLGIGLNIVRNLVELHGGRVTAHSSGLHLGSEFVVHLPIDSASLMERALPEAQVDETDPEGSAGSRASADPKKDGRRVLVVDDSPDIADSTATLLSLRGHLVAVANNGEQALMVAARFHPEVILMDLGMPGLDGFSVAQKMREDQNLRHVLLIAVSGYGTDADRKHAP
jgi:CheY-like chemotaxis protein